VLHGAQGIGAGGSAGPLGGEGCDSQQDRDRDRKRGFRDEGSKLAGLAAWDKDVKGWVEDVGESSRLPQSLDYSFPQGDGLNRRCIVICAEILDADSERLKLRCRVDLRIRDTVHRYPCRNA
jgi:hypothetical protein